MTTQLSLPDTDTTDNHTGLVTPRHINHGISGNPGIQDVETVPGLKFIKGFLTPEQQAYCVKRG